VTRIELALSAWEVQRSRLLAALTCGCRCPLVAVVAPSSPWLMARQWHGDHAPSGGHRERLGLLCVPCISPVLLVAAGLGRGRRVKAREATAQRLGLDSTDSAKTIVQRGGRNRPVGRVASRERLYRRCRLPAARGR
jgi:hypothetical protein